MDDAASSCDIQQRHLGGAGDDECVSASAATLGAIACELHPSLVELIELSLQRCAPEGLSVSSSGPAAPPRGGAGYGGHKRASCGGGGRGLKRRPPPSPADAIALEGPHEERSAAAAAGAGSQPVSARGQASNGWLSHG